MAKLFLSYSRKDWRKARRFAECLERDGHDVWRDDNDIRGGASFSSEIEKALDESNGVVVLWSAESVQSSWVRDEAAFGRDAGKLIPFSLDGTEPPLGFRQFQTIDLSHWRGRDDPSSVARIRNAIARLEGSARSGATNTRADPGGRLSRKTGIAASRLVPGFLVIAAAVLAALFWRHSGTEREFAILVSPSPTSSDRATAADYANVAAADMAGFLPTRFARVRVIAPGDVATGGSAYRVEIATDRHGKAADASLTLSDRDGRSILWSKSWSVPDASAIDLREQVSLAASQAALCLNDARGGATKLEQPALGLYINACVGVTDPNVSDAALVATLERVVQLKPNFARAWAMLSVGRAILAEAQKTRSGTSKDAAISKAEQAIAIARKLDPRSGLPYLAQWRLNSEDPLVGLRLLDRAVEIDPDEPVLHARRCDALQAVGRMSDAIEAAHRATELDPLWSFPRARYIDALAYAGQFSRAKEEIAVAHRRWPLNSEIDYADFAYQYRYGDPRVAEQLMPRVLDIGDAQLLPYRKLLAARLDPSRANVDDAIAGLRQFEAKDPRARNAELLALGLFGRVDDAYRLIGDPQFQPHLDVAILFRPEFAAVRADARFIRVAARLGLVRYWQQSGNWPDYCATEKLSYDCRSEAAKY